MLESNVIKKTASPYGTEIFSGFMYNRFIDDKDDELRNVTNQIEFHYVERCLIAGQLGNRCLFTQSH